MLITQTFLQEQVKYYFQDSDNEIIPVLYKKYCLI